MSGRLKIGTRGSPLALVQAEDVKRRLVEAHAELDEQSVDIIEITTSGDRILDRHLMLAGGKGLFTKEIEEALLSGDIDLAVHSCKDMPTRLPEGLELSTYLPRENPRDVFLSADGSRFEDLATGATLGTASLRRRAQALKARPDLKIVTFRGSVDTRITKLKAGEADGTFLARAGLNRLGKSVDRFETLDTDRFLPAPAQGIVTLEIRSNDTKTRALLDPLDSEESRICAAAERAYLEALDGSCRTPIAAHAEVSGGSLTLVGELLSVDGQSAFREMGTAPVGDARTLGLRLGKAARKKAGEAFFEQLQKEAEEVIA